MRLSLVTCTGARPEAFALCERWMSRQSVAWDQWVVVDDCEPETKLTCGQESVKPRPPWAPGSITLGRNLFEGLKRVNGDVIAVIEDDDWYAPNYLERTLDLIEKAPLVGEGWARYYNVRSRRYTEQANARHACLACTAWRSELTQSVIDVLTRLGRPCYDLSIWRAIQDFALSLSERNYVGIKGMPGRGGIGIGHTDHLCRHDDPKLEKLREWIGDDATVYEAYRR